MTDESELVFNVVFTPGTFRYLAPFTSSLLANSSARFRLVANGCPADEVHAMQAFAARNAGRVGVHVASSTEMLKHGAALEETYASHDDGRFFCFIDSDVMALRPFADELLSLLARFSVVTTGDIAWADDRVLPPGSRDLAGRHAVGHDGFMYGSSYVALYSRPALESVRTRWGITFPATPDDRLPEPVRARLTALGRHFTLYDTAKALNILLQGDGSTLHHFDHPGLLHLGGISQYLSHPAPTGTAGPDPRPWFAQTPSGRRRWEFAEWVAHTLMTLLDGAPTPDLPAVPADRDLAFTVQRQLRELVDTYA